MNWQLDLQSAETMANASCIPSSLEIITLIKRVNPTKLCLSESDRERGYQAKTKLQNLLLENYGEVFHLAPHPYSERIILIKHAALPSIDACHADLNSLSAKALEAVAAPALKPHSRKEGRQSRQGKAATDAASDCSPKEALRIAQQRLEEYDYAEAEAILTRIRIAAGEELAILEKTVRMLAQEMGAYEQAIETLLAQPKQILKEKTIRELLALTYHQNGMVPEARAIFDSLHPCDLGKEALYAYADLSFKDGNFSQAFNLIGMADEQDGYVAVAAGLRKDIEAGMLAEAEPVLQRALSALDGGDHALGDSLAREVLEYYPNHRKAREIVALVGSAKEAAEIAGLWESFALAEKSEEKIDLLTRLLERERHDKEGIRRLIAEERADQKKKLVDGRLRDLRTCVDRDDWPACHAILHWLAAQKDHREEYREACSMSPYFSVLRGNRQLRMLNEKASRELWLEFVKVKSSLQSRQKGSFEIMDGIKEYFLPYPEFRDDYLMLVGIEQERARGEIRDLLRRIEAAAGGGSQNDQAFGDVRRAMAVLPVEERCEYGRRLEVLSARRQPVRSEKDPTQMYRKARLIGDEGKAASLRARTGDPASLDKIDEEISELFRIDSQAVALAMSDDLPVELYREPSLVFHASTDRHLIFKEDEGALVIANLVNMTATRYASEHFKNVVFSDAIPDKETFLFLDTVDATAWRAELSGGRGVFTATFCLMEKLANEYEEIVAVYLSSDKVTECYVNFADWNESRTGRFAKEKIDRKKGEHDVIRFAAQPEVRTRRALSEPDMFIVGARDDTGIYNKNLKLLDGRVVTSDIWEVDPANCHIYYFHSHQLNRVDFQFDNSVDFPYSPACGFFNKHKVQGLCPALETAMVGFKEKAVFYNYVTNMVSTPFRSGNVVCNRPARRYYSFDYRKESRELILRDIDAEIGTLLKWEAFDLMDDKWRDDDWFARTQKRIYLGDQHEPEPEEIAAEE